MYKCWCEKCGYISLPDSRNFKKATKHGREHSKTCKSIVRITKPVNHFDKSYVPIRHKGGELVSVIGYSGS